MSKAALYCRFSTDKQREASIEDQARVCRARAEREGWEIVAQHADNDVSGSVPVADRRGGAALLADAMAKRFDVLLMEDLSRLSRDMPESERIVRRLEFRGIRIIGVSDGYDSEANAQSRKMHRYFKGMFNEMALEEVRYRVHRSLDGLVASGLFAGGLPYGYTSIEAAGGHWLAIHVEQARWVLFIFERFADGWGPRRIAAELNGRGVPAPRGGSWAVSAIYGNKRKTCGILNNPLYAGVYIWNRSKWLKDPDSGKRKRIERPESEWRRRDVPDLRIVPEELWQAVKRRQGPMTRARGGSAPRTLLSGLLRCGCCGGAVVAVSQYFYGCAARKDRGPAVCEGVRVQRKRLEAALMAVIRDDLLSPSALAQLQAHVRDILRERRAAANQAGLCEQLRKVEGEVQNLVEAIAACGISPALRQRLTEAEAQRDRLQAELAAAAAPIPDIVPRLRERFHALLGDLSKTLARRPEAARAAIKDLLGQVSLTKTEGEVWAELNGCYQGLFARFVNVERSPATISRITRRLKIA